MDECLFLVSLRDIRKKIFLPLPGNHQCSFLCTRIQIKVGIMHNTQGGYVDRTSGFSGVEPLWDQKSKESWSEQLWAVFVWAEMWLLQIYASFKILWYLRQHFMYFRHLKPQSGYFLGEFFYFIFLSNVRRPLPKHPCSPPPASFLLPLPPLYITCDFTPCHWVLYQ